VPPSGFASAIADVDNLEPLLKTASPLSIPTVTFF